MIRVLLADDHPVVRAGLRRLLESEPDIVVVEEATSGEDACVRYRELRPDVVLMDLSMPGFGGIEAVRRIKAGDENARIVVFTVHNSEVLLSRALDAGAQGFITKGSDSELITNAVREVLSGGMFFSPDLASHLAGFQKSKGKASVESLTHREFQIFRLIAEGETVNRAADRLRLSPKTVSNHLTRIKHKLGAFSTADVTRIAIRHGVVDA